MNTEFFRDTVGIGESLHELLEEYIITLFDIIVCSCWFSRRPKQPFVLNKSFFLDL